MQEEKTYIIKDIIEKVRLEDEKAFARFSSEHSICFTEANGDWLFPAMYDFYTEEVRNPSITKMLQELGMLFHNESLNTPMPEITSLDRSLCLDESQIYQYILKQQALVSKDVKNAEVLKSPYKTKTEYLAFRHISPIDHEWLIIEYGGIAHPYILADIAGVLIYSNKIRESFDYLRRSTNLLIEFPNKFWNSELAITGAANTFRWLRLMCQNDMDLSRKIFKYNYLYLTRMACITRDDLLEQSAYANRAALVKMPFAYTFLPFIGQNPDTLYISDLYYAQFCNQTATEVSVLTNSKYYQQSLTYYQNASLWPNDTGGYADIEEDTYLQLVERKHKVALLNAYEYWKELNRGEDVLTESDIDKIFILIEQEYNNHFNRFRNNILNYNKY
jgi:hypothetical protein